MRPAAVGFQCPDDVRLGQVRQRTAVGATLRENSVIVTSGLILANMVAYLASMQGAPGGLTNPTGSKFFRAWQEFPPAIALNDEYYRLMTSAFLHVSLLHITLNMVALWFVGPPLERLLGPARFSALYLLGALGGSGAEYVFGDALQSTVGASGAIFGLFAAILLFARELRVDLRQITVTVVLNFILTFTIPGISVLGHVGGFVVGGAAALAIGGLPRNRVRLSATRQWGGLVLLLSVLVVTDLIRTAAFPSFG